MNDKGIRAGIVRRIEELPDDAVFTVTDFVDIADSTNIRQAFKTLTEDGTISRACRGVYYKPRYSTLLDMQIPPSVDGVVRAIARARGWTIAPSGDTALNRIGLDTQVPAKYSYISTGPYTSIRIGPFDVLFRHSTSKDLVGMSPSTLLVVCALKALGKGRVGTKEIKQISNRLSEDEKRRLLQETVRSTEWIRRAACEIAGKGSTC